MVSPVHVNRQPLPFVVVVIIIVVVVSTFFFFFLHPRLIQCWLDPLKNQCGHWSSLQNECSICIRDMSSEFEDILEHLKRFCTWTCQEFLWVRLFWWIPFEGCSLDVLSFVYFLCCHWSFSNESLLPQKK